MYKFFLILVFCVIQFPSFVQAETISEKSQRLCRAYVERPSDFKKIKLEDCKIYPYQEAQELESAKCFIHNVEGVEKPVKFVTNYTGLGSCSSNTVNEISEGDHPQPLFNRDIANSSVNGYTFGGNDIALDYEGELLISNQSKDLRLVTKYSQIVLCQFCQKFVKWENIKSQNKVCDLLAEENFLDKGNKIEQSDWGKWPKAPIGSPENYFDVDLDHDGSKEKIVRYQFDDGGGCGCTQQSLIPLENGQLPVLETKPSPTQQNLASKLKEITGDCLRFRNQWTIVGIEGKDYLLNSSYPDPETKVFRGENRTLFDYIHGKFVKVCEQKPITKLTEDRYCGDSYRSFKRTYEPYLD